jgi:hypothetical protein
MSPAAFEADPQLPALVKKYGEPTSDIWKSSPCRSDEFESFFTRDGG